MSCSRSVLQLVAGLCFVVVSGCAGISANHQPTELTRRQAAGQFVCHEQDVEVKELGSSEVQATGCGKTATWSCSGDSDGHSTVELLDRRCSRVTDITSIYGAAKAKAPAPNTAKPADASGASSSSSSSDSSVGAFPREDARTALRAAQDGLRSCRPIAGDLSPLEATIRFEPTGKVTKVDLNGSPSTSSETSTCVRTRLSEISIPKFAGEAVTVKMPIRF